MAGEHRRYSVEFKREVVQQYLAGELSPHAIARHHRISRTLVLLWARKFAAGELSGPVAEDLERRELEGRVAFLERKVGQLVLENELLKKTLPRYRSLSDANSSIVSGPRPSVSEEDVE
jgi:transposase